MACLRASAFDRMHNSCGKTVSPSQDGAVPVLALLHTRKVVLQVLELVCRYYQEVANASLQADTGEHWLRFTVPL